MTAARKSSTQCGAHSYCFRKQTPNRNQSVARGGFSRNGLLIGLDRRFKLVVDRPQYQGVTQSLPVYCRTGIIRAPC